MVISLAASGLCAAKEPGVGHWLWADHQTLVFRGDKTVATVQGKTKIREGRWQIKNPAGPVYTVIWADGATQELSVSADGWTLEATRPDGLRLRAERLDEEE